MLVSLVVGKHFPGHGDTDLDSHVALLSKVAHELSVSEKSNGRRLKAAVDAGLGAIMTAHVVIESIDENIPATFSKMPWIFFEMSLVSMAWIASDDLEMKAVADRYAVEEMAILNEGAGLDHYLVCEKPEMILDFYRALIEPSKENTLRMSKSKRRQTQRRLAQAILPGARYAR